MTFAPDGPLVVLYILTIAEEALPGVVSAMVHSCSIVDFNSARDGGREVLSSSSDISLATMEERSSTVELVERGRVLKGVTVFR